MQGHLAVHPHQQAAFMPVPQPLPSSAPHPDYMSQNGLMATSESLSDLIAQSSAPEQCGAPASAFPRQQEYNHMVPTIVQSPQHDANGAIVHNMHATGYAVQEPHVVAAGMASEGSMAYQTFGQPMFAGDSQYTLAPGFNQYGEMPQGMPQQFAYAPYMHDNSPPLQSIEHGMPIMQAPQPLSPMPSLTAPYNNPNWSDEANPGMTVATGSPQSLDGSVADVQTNQQNEFWHSMPSLEQAHAPKGNVPARQPLCSVLVHSTGRQPQSACRPRVPGRMLSCAATPSTSMLADTLDAVGINPPSDSESSFKEPGPPSSIAARRQRPRAAASWIGRAPKRVVQRRHASLSRHQPKPRRSRAAAASDQVVEHVGPHPEADSSFRPAIASQLQLPRCRQLAKVCPPRLHAVERVESHRLHHNEQPRPAHSQHAQRSFAVALVARVGNQGVCHQRKPQPQRCRRVLGQRSGLQPAHGQCFVAARHPLGNGAGSSIPGVHAPPQRGHLPRHASAVCASNTAELLAHVADAAAAVVIAAALRRQNARAAGPRCRMAPTRCR